MRITSDANPHYKQLQRLAAGPRACREAGRTLAEGIHLVECAVAAGTDILTVVLSEAAAAEAKSLGAAVAASASCRTIELPPRLYNALSPVEHGSGILVEIATTRHALPRALEADAIYLDGVQDPGNAGTLLRTAAAAGVRHVAASTGTTFLWSPKVLRAAMGAHFVLSLYEDVPADQLAGAFAAERLAADAYGAESLFSAGWGTTPTLWLFGAEGAGLAETTASQAQRRLRIPIDPKVESLNVAAAAAVCLFEQRRRRGKE
jgi:RNA methyltransferase, TrmH family